MPGALWRFHCRTSTPTLCGYAVPSGDAPRNNRSNCRLHGIGAMAARPRRRGRGGIVAAKLAPLRFVAAATIRRSRYDAATMRTPNGINQKADRAWRWKCAWRGCCHNQGHCLNVPKERTLKNWQRFPFFLQRSEPLRQDGAPPCPCLCDKLPRAES